MRKEGFEWERRDLSEKEGMRERKNRKKGFE